MSKYGYNPDEHFQTKVTLIDKDGFHKESDEVPGESNSSFLGLHFVHTGDVYTTVVAYESILWYADGGVNYYNDPYHVLVYYGDKKNINDEMTIEEYNALIEEIGADKCDDLYYNGIHDMFGVAHINTNAQVLNAANTISICYGFVLENIPEDEDTVNVLLLCDYYDVDDPGNGVYKPLQFSAKIPNDYPRN